MLKSLFNWKVLSNFALVLGLLTAIIWCVFRWLEFHTNHGQEIEVPNVINLNVKEAIGVLEENGLTYEVDSFKFDPKYKSFQVLQVYPNIGSHVKDGRKVILRVNPKTWAKVTVPDIIDRYKQLAFRQLDVVGLKVKDTLYEPSISKDAVVRMEFNGRVLKPGELLSKFSEIDLIIGEGPKRDVPIPNLIGLSYAEAKEILKQNYFEIGVLENYDGKVDDASIIYYQDPASGALRDQGMQIDLWTSHSPILEMQEQISILDNIYKLREPEPVNDIPTENLPPVVKAIQKPKTVDKSKIIEKPKTAVTPKTTEKPKVNINKEVKSQPKIEKKKESEKSKKTTTDNKKEIKKELKQEPKKVIKHIE